MSEIDRQTLCQGLHGRGRNQVGGEFENGCGERGGHLHYLGGGHLKKGAEAFHYLRITTGIVDKGGIAGRYLATGKGGVQKSASKPGTLSHQVIGGGMIDGGVVHEGFARP